MAAEYLERMGDRIRQRREELGLTQEDLARQMPGKITGARVSLWERGKNRPRDDSLEALATVLQTTVAHFMASDGDKTTGTPNLSAVSGDGPVLERIEGYLREACAEREHIRERLTTIENHLEVLAAMAELLGEVPAAAPETPRDGEAQRDGEERRDATDRRR